MKYARKTLPTYAKVAFDLYFNHLDINEVAKKYNRTTQQIKWLISKCVRPNLFPMWKKIIQSFHNKKITYRPFYTQVAIYMCQNNANKIEVMEKYNCSRRQVNDALRRVNWKLPILYNYINNVVLSKKERK